MQFAEISVVANPGYPTFPLAPAGGSTVVPQGGSVTGFQSFGPKPPYVTAGEAQYFDSDINVAHAPGIVSVCVSRRDTGYTNAAYFPRGSVVTVYDNNASLFKQQRRHPKKELCHGALLSCGCKKVDMYVKGAERQNSFPLGVLAEAVRFEKGEIEKVVPIAVKGANDVVINCVDGHDTCNPLNFIPGRTYFIGHNGIMADPISKYALPCKVLVAPGPSDKTVNVYLI